MSLHPGNTAVSATSSCVSSSSSDKRKMEDSGEGERTRFWVVCCGETEVTQRISEEVDKWGLPSVRSLLIPPSSEQAPISEYRHNLPSSEAHAVAQSEYAIFITPSEQPCAQMKVSPLNKVCNRRRASKPSANNQPAMLLTALHNRHGQSPQAWWLQLPNTEIRAKSTRPVPSQRSVAQALDKIGIFIRNYQMSAAPTAINNQSKSAAVREMATEKVAAASSA